MAQALHWTSPRSHTGSLATSLLVHGLLCGVTVVIMNAKVSPVVAPSGDLSLEYEMLTAPPEPEQRVRHVVRSPEPEVIQPVKSAPTVTQELQDSQSDVVGTQAAAPTRPSTDGSESDGSAHAVPYYKIKPKYPRAALVAGEEGWIMLKIDIAESGEVENVRVVDGIKRSLFQDEARRAVEKWKYKPFVNDGGVPTRKADHLVRVDFKLQDA